MARGQWWLTCDCWQTETGSQDDVLQSWKKDRKKRIKATPSPATKAGERLTMKPNTQPVELAAASSSAKIPLWIVMGREDKDKPWKAYAAYPSRIQAEVYASNFSTSDKVKIFAGVFSPNAEVRHGATDSDAT